LAGECGSFLRRSGGEKSVGLRGELCTRDTQNKSNPRERRESNRGRSEAEERARDVCGVLHPVFDFFFQFFLPLYSIIDIKIASSCSTTGPDWHSGFLRGRTDCGASILLPVISTVPDPDKRTWRPLCSPSAEVRRCILFDLLCIRNINVSLRWRVGNRSLHGPQGVGR
jgi:hypothetical protein